MNKKIYILGRTGTGKDSFTGEMIRLMKEDGHDAKMVISYTTRPKRSPDENTHIFISTDEAAKLTERAAETVINNYVYFATKQQVLDSDMYIIDPRGLYQVLQNLPDTEAVIIYIDSDKALRRTRAISRGDHDTEAAVFEKREASENAEFDNFESLLSEIVSSGKIPYENVKNVIIVDNNRSQKELRLKAQAVYMNILNTEVPAIMKL